MAFPDRIASWVHCVCAEQRGSVDSARPLWRRVCRLVKERPNVIKNERRSRAGATLLAPAARATHCASHAPPHAPPHALPPTRSVARRLDRRYIRARPATFCPARRRRRIRLGRCRRRRHRRARTPHRKRRASASNRARPNNRPLAACMTRRSLNGGSGALLAASALGSASQGSEAARQRASDRVRVIT